MASEEEAGIVEDGSNETAQKGHGKLQLKHGVTMEVKELSSDSNGELIVKMSWNVPKRSIVNKRVMVKYSDISQNRAKDSVYNQLSGAVFIEGVRTQQSGFSQFLDQEIEAFEERRVGGEEEDNKACVEFKEVSVHKSGDHYFLICSESVVFVLNGENSYSTKLSAEAIGRLDFSIVWLGPKVKVQYESNDEMAVSAMLNIINNVNDFYGFPLGSLVSHLRGFLYEEILDEQKTFYTTITVSGDERGTGKSLLFSVGQNLLYGRIITADKHISDAMMYKKLAGETEEGKVPVYVNEWDGSSKLFNNSVKGIWEGSQWASRVGSYKPRTVLLCNANATPESIKFDAGVRSKVSFLNTGPDRLDHENKLEITKKIVTEAKESHKFLPSIIGIAVRTLMKGVNDEDRRKYSHEVQDAGDERETQVLKDFDSLLEELADAVDRYKFPSPPLFQCDVPHTCLTSFNEVQTDQTTTVEDREEARKNAASSFIDYLMETDKLSVLSPKTFRGSEGFKIDSSEIFSPEAQSNLRKATDSHTTRLHGRSIKFRFLLTSRITGDHMTVINDFLTSFQYLYSCTLKEQQNQLEQFSSDFLEMIRISSEVYDREHVEVEQAMRDSITDEVDEVEELSCGVDKCPSGRKVWDSQDKLDKHRSTRAHKRAAGEDGTGQSSQLTAKDNTTKKQKSELDIDI